VLFNLILIELKSLIDKRNITIVCLLLVFSILLVQNGINTHIQLDHNRQDFIKSENALYTQYNNWNQYGGYGIMGLLHPSSPLFVLTSTSGGSQIVTHVDTGSRFRIVKQYKGSESFKRSYLFNDFSTFFYFSLSLIALMLGAKTFNNYEYFRFLVSLSHVGKVFFVFFFIKFLIIFVLFSFIFITASSWPLLWGINLFTPKLLILFLSALLSVTFFFVLGVTLSLVNKKTRIVLVFSVYAFINILIPAFVNHYARIASFKIDSNYKVETTNLAKLMDYEKKVIAGVHNFKKNNPNSSKDHLNQLVYKFVLGLKKKEHIDFKSKENKILSQVENVVIKTHFLSSLFPSTFFLSTSKELSGEGLIGEIHFFKFALKLKYSFFDWFADNKFVHSPNHLIQFPGKNIFDSKSQLPMCFDIGVITTIIWVTLIAIFSFFQFKKSLFPTEEEEDYVGVRINIAPNKSSFYHIDSDSLMQAVKNVFFGQYNSFNGSVSSEKGSIVYKAKKNFTYLPNPIDIQNGYLVKDFLSFINSISGLCITENTYSKCYFSEIPIAKRIEILLTIGEKSKSRFVVLNNFFDNHSLSPDLWNRSFEKQISQNIASIVEQKAVISLSNKDRGAKLFNNVFLISLGRKGYKTIKIK
jgi:hypothetical protein